MAKKTIPSKSNTFFGSRTKNNHGLSLVQMIYIATFLYLLTKIYSADAETIYPLDLNTDINYQIDFNPLQFPQMRNAIVSYCSVYLKGSSQGNYTSSDSPQCLSEDNTLGPAVQVGIQKGKEMTANFKYCLGQAMKYMCDQYYNKSAVPDDKSGIPEVIGITAVVIISLVVLCSVFAFKSCKGDEQSNQDRQNNNETTSLLSAINRATAKNNKPEEHHGASVVWNKPHR